MIRRSLSDPTDWAYHLCSAPVGITLATLVAVTGNAGPSRRLSGQAEETWARTTTKSVATAAGTEYHPRDVRPRVPTVIRAASAGKGGHHIPTKTSSRSPSPRFAGSSTSTFQSKNTSNFTTVRESPGLAAAHQPARSCADGSKAGRVGSKASASAVESHCW